MRWLAVGIAFGAVVGCATEISNELTVTDYLEAEPLSYSQALALIEEHTIGEVEIRPSPGPEISESWYQLGEEPSAQTWKAKGFQVFMRNPRSAERVPVVAPGGETIELSEAELTGLLEAVDTANEAGPRHIAVNDLRSVPTPTRD